MSDRRTRADLAHAADAVLALPGVEAAEVYPSQARDRPVLELTLSTTERVPPRVGRTLAEHDCGVDLDHSGTRPEHTVVVAY